MEYSIRFTEEGKKSLQSLHIETQSLIKKELKLLSKNLSIGKPLTGRLRGFFSLPIKKYRAIYSLSDSTIIVHYVSHRDTVYKKNI